MDNSNERRKQWIKAHPELVVKPSMKRRKAGHDYCSVAIYMVTLCIAGRRPVLGTLHGPDANHKKPWVYPSSIGAAVKVHGTKYPNTIPKSDCSASS